MNDFTKEELEDIYEAVMDTSIAMFIYLPSKIQSMIDNYCDHKEKFNDYDTCPIERCKNCCGIINE
jgi:hypothetical protein